LFRVLHVCFIILEDKEVANKLKFPPPEIVINRIRRVYICVVVSTFLSLCVILTFAIMCFVVTLLLLMASCLILELFFFGFGVCVVFVVCLLSF